MAARPPTPASADAQESVPHAFVRRLAEFIAALQYVFGDEEADEGIAAAVVKLNEWAEMLHAVIFGRDVMETMVTLQWHREMTTHCDGTPRTPSLYDLTRARDAYGVFASDVWVFAEIDSKTLFDDPGLDDASRASMWKHIDALNAIAEGFAATDA
jgi:hypothetical protein